MTTQQIPNRTIFEGDNLDVLRGINSESVDLIYLDPPFNSNRNYAAPIGSEAAGAKFKDTWTLSDVDNAWHGEIADKNPALYRAIDAAELTHGKGMKSYLIMMAVRLLEMKRVLKDTGSIYLHVDPTASHYLKLLMDSVFGKDNFRNEIIWHYQAGTKSRTRFGKKHDVILYYSKGKNPTFHRQGQPVQNPKRYNKQDENGDWYDTNGQGKRYYLKDGQTCADVWTYVQESEFNSLNSQSKERTGYPTQKPLAVLRRIIEASSNEGDVVLDPFAGCATTCIAAEQLNRKWIGMDLSPQAAKQVEARARKELGMLGGMQATHRTDIPVRTDIGSLPNYRTHKHTLYGKQEGNCAGCKVHFPFRNFTVDHYIPTIKGGTDHYDNLQLLCGMCNSVKGERPMEYLIAKLREDGIID